jgi:hypothetical protein
LTHDGWVNGGWYESLFARRRRSPGAQYQPPEIP